MNGKHSRVCIDAHSDAEFSNAWRVDLVCRPRNRNRAFDATRWCDYAAGAARCAGGTHQLEIWTIVRARFRSSGRETANATCDLDLWCGMVRGAEFLCCA